MAEKLIIKRPRQTLRFYRDYIDNISLELALIPDGTFTMGAPEDEEGSRDNERPQHDVTLSSFLMGRYPVTQAQWKVIALRTDLKVNIHLEEDPSRFKDPYEGIDRWLRPVEQVNWYEAVEFCQRLSKLTGRDYRLPSEAQWEYACRGVTKPLDLSAEETYPPFHFGDTITTKLANYNGTNEKYGAYGKGPKGEYREQTTPVGYFDVANAFGLSDMHGLVWEWCADDWHDNYEGAPTDGSAWMEHEASYLAKNKQNDSYSVLRGGSWLYNPNNCRSAIRYYNYRRGNLNNDLGFRVVCVFGRTQ
ncbi:formylglycine-generating enzyme family protein [Crocosphaera sp.]|uniref:formylglycine-generating enzyme family protein n=1 Tax=Crocosphaera sp. TaxID=2729996 RepID=UPI00260B6715|nr:formylglycine-generating enzyme family protein [Crocosphaera sp.]MDJ0582924.1 formylglycine-generating enzyme family protein [Crocosphaera sp.]